MSVERKIDRIYEEEKPYLDKEIFEALGIFARVAPGFTYKKASEPIPGRTVKKGINFEGRCTSSSGCKFSGKRVIINLGIPSSQGNIQGVQCTECKEPFKVENIGFLDCTLRLSVRFKEKYMKNYDYISKDVYRTWNIKEGELENFHELKYKVSENKLEDISCAVCKKKLNPDFESIMKQEKKGYFHLSCLENP